MATSNSRDVSLKILVETLGQESVDKLKLAFDQLAKEGASAAPEVKKLTDAIDRIGQSNEAINALTQLGDEAGKLAVREQAAAAALTETTERLTAQRTAVVAAREAQAQANATLLAASQAQTDTATALKLLRTEYDAAGKKTDEFKTKQRELLTTQGEQIKRIAELRQAQSAANSEVVAAESAQAKLEVSQRRAALSAQAAADASQAQQRALSEARAAATALGISTDNLAAAEEALAVDMRAVVAAAESRVTSIREMAEADRLLSIEERTLVGLLQQGAAALQAEEAAHRDAARSAREYAEAKERATANAAEWQREADAIVNTAEAAQRLERATRVLVAAQAELGAQRTFERQAADAQRLLKAAEYVRFWEAELQSAEDQARQTADAATQAAQRISDAFSTVGVRSVEQLRAEIVSTRAAMATIASQAATTGQALTGAFTAGEQRIAALEREIRSVTGQLTLADRAADLFKNSLGQIAAGNVIADGIGYLVNKVKELSREFITVTVQTERMRKGLQAVYKDSTRAAQQFQFLRDTAQQSGFSIGSTSDAFLRFSAATKSANLPLSVTNDLFVAVTRAGTTLGLTGEQVTGTLDALGQMASKGVVSMEELRQQLGDRLPGALSLAAQGLGITDQQLIKLVESGQLATRDFFPAFAAGLKTLAGDTNTLVSGWQRFTNMLNEFAVSVGDAGGLDVLKASLSAFAAVLGVVLVPLQGFIEFLGLAGKAIGLFIGALTTGDFKGAFAEFDKQIDASASRIRSFHRSLDVAVNGIGEQEKAVAKSNVAMEKNASGVLSVVAAQERLAAGTGATSSAFVQQIVRLQENATAVEAAVTSSEKLLRAKQEEGKALVTTANLTGAANKALDAASTAAVNNAAASEQVVAARLREVTITQQSIALINGERDARGRLTSDRQAALDKLSATLIVQEAELEKSRATTLELGRQALAAEAASDAYADNTTKLGEYQRAMENTRVEATLLADQVERQTFALGELKEELADNKITQEAYDTAKRDLLATTDRLNAATGNAARYENLYRDAVADSVAATDRKAHVESANLGVTEALVKVQQAHYETLARQAKALGDEAAATYYTVEAKNKQIEAIKLATQIKNLELQADQAGVEIQIAALDPQDKLYAQKKQELEIRLQIIKAKQIEAQASREVIKGIEDEITAIRNRAAQQGGSVNTIGGNQGGGGGGNGPRGTRPGPAGDRDRRGGGSGSEREEFGRTADGFERKADGAMRGTATNLAPVDKAFQVMQDRGKKYTGDDVEYLQAAKKQADDAKAWLDAMARSGGAGSISAEAWRSAQGLQQATNNALQQALRAQRMKERDSGEAGSTRTVTVNINGRPVTVASKQDSDVLVGVLRELENQSGTAAP